MPKTIREIIEDYEMNGSSMKQKYYSEEEYNKLKERLETFKREEFIKKEQLKDLVLKMVLKKHYQQKNYLKNRI